MANVGGDSDDCQPVLIKLDFPVFINLDLPVLINYRVLGPGLFCPSDSGP